MSHDETQMAVEMPSCRMTLVPSGETRGIIAKTPRHLWDNGASFYRFDLLQGAFGSAHSLRRARTTSPMYIVWRPALPRLA